MLKRSVLGMIVGLLLALALIGCSRDPNVRKQKYLESGNRYMAKQKYKEAAIQYSNAIRVDSQFAEAHYQLAQAELKLGSIPLAYREFLRTIQIQPDRIQARIDVAKILLIARDFAKAQDQADAVLASNPNNVEALQIKADANAGLNHTDVAEQEMNRAIELDPNRSESYLNLAVLQSTSPGEVPQAEESFKKSIDLSPNAVAPHLAYASFLDHHQRPDEAEHEIREAISLDQTNVTARALLVNHYLRLNRKDLAEQAAKDAQTELGSDPRQAKFLAKYYLGTGDTAAASSEMAALAKQFPKDRETQHAYLELLLAQNQDDDAMRQVEAILKNNHNDAIALIGKGLLLLKKNNPMEARTALQQALKNEPQNVAGHYQLGLTFKVLGNSGEAESQWREAVRLKPDYLPAQNALAQMTLEKHDYTGLQEIAAAVKKASPKSIDGYLLQATADMKQLQFPQAEAELRAAIQANPRSAEAHSQLGLLLIGLKRDKEAEPELTQALQINPANFDALAGLNQIDIHRKQDAKAISRMETITGKYPTSPTAHYLFAKLLAYEKNLPRATEEMKQTLTLRPDFQQAYFDLAKLQLQQNDKDGAIATYKTVIDKNPRDPAAYLMLGMIYDEQGKPQDAEAAYRKALDIKPDLAAAANNLAYLLLQHGGNIDEVITYAEVARRQMPESPSVADTLGWAYSQKGVQGLAIGLLQDAAKKSPDNATFHYHLGVAYEKSGDKTHAKVEFEKAIQLDAGKPELQEVQKSLAELNQA